MSPVARPGFQKEGCKWEGKRKWGVIEGGMSFIGGGDSPTLLGTTARAKRISNCHFKETHRRKGLVL